MASTEKNNTGNVHTTKHSCNVYAFSALNDTTNISKIFFHCHQYIIQSQCWLQRHRVVLSVGDVGKRSC